MVFAHDTVSLYRINSAIALIQCTMVASALSETLANWVNNRGLRPRHGIIVSNHVAIALIHCTMVGPAFSDFWQMIMLHFFSVLTYTLSTRAVYLYFQ